MQFCVCNKYLKVIFILLLVYKYPIKIKYYSEKTTHSSLNPLWFYVPFTGYTFCWPHGKGFKLEKKNPNAFFNLYKKINP